MQGHAYGTGLQAAAAGLAGRLAGQPPWQYRGPGGAIAAAWHRSPLKSFEAALQAQLRCLDSGDFQAARQAMAEGQRPHWRER